MIKIGIEGADCRSAGELIRILVNHPDVELISLCSRKSAGLTVSSCHHGLIGETDICFSDNIDLNAVDTVFICSRQNPESAERILENGKLKIIDLSPERVENDPGWVFGLSEIYRKPMVRGASKAVIPHTAESMALVALYPLAANLLLSKSPTILFEAPEDIIKDSSGSGHIIASHLRQIQQSFVAGTDILFKTGTHPRICRMKISIPLQLDIDHTLSLYDAIYDDHNFTFLRTSPVDSREVAGTEKCIVSISKQSADTLDIDIIADGRMRGGAGEAVHVMNLLHGLHEKTGLTFRSSEY